MSTPNVEVMGAQVTAGGGIGHVPGVDVLAFTGTGPGTLPLAIIGFLTLVTGFLATFVSRRKRDANPGTSDGGPLRDLTHLASGPLRDLA